MTEERLRGQGSRLRREQRQRQARERQAAHDVLTPEDQLARIESRPGSSKREHSKLLGAIEQRGKTTKKKEKEKA